MGVFRFKQFQLTDDHSAMKVGMDSVLLACWLRAANYSRILDVGCGSGLIALILAQRFPNAQINGIDIDADSLLDANENFRNSPWNGRLSAMHKDVREYQAEQSFDLIVTNPPYFSESLLPPETKRAGVRHDIHLSLAELLWSARRLLSAGGTFALVFPYERADELLNQAGDVGFYSKRIMYLRNKPGAQIKRIFVEFVLRKPETEVEKEYLFVRNAEGDYAPEYREITKDFYLKF